MTHCADTCDAAGYGCPCCAHDLSLPAQPPREGQEASASGHAAQYENGTSTTAAPILRESTSTAGRGNFTAAPGPESRER